MSQLTKRVKIYTSLDVATHASSTDCWVSRNGKVYDVTPFLADHPGGDDLILRYAGKDLGDIMADKSEHEHSDSAYEMLNEYVIGRLGSDAVVVSDGTLPHIFTSGTSSLGFFIVYRLGRYR
jgi:4-hydroxysphinganine ceramide fatty acyl 2-hydroxylase